jgi:hypothetical protein
MEFFPPEHRLHFLVVLLVYAALKATSVSQKLLVYAALKATSVSEKLLVYAALKAGAHTVNGVFFSPEHRLYFSCPFVFVFVLFCLLFYVCVYRKWLFPEHRLHFLVVGRSNLGPMP